MRRIRLLLVSVIALAACTSKEKAASSSVGETGGTLIIPTPGDAVDLFPPYVNEATGRLVQDMVFDRLAEIDTSLTTVGDKTFTPRIARSWTWAPDSLSIAFSIDPRARWHDGKPVLASDVRYTFKVFTDPKVGSPVAPTLTNLDSVTVRDSLTAVVWFKRHTPEQFYDVAYQLIIIPEHVYGTIPLDQLHTSELARNPIGSGRFRLAKWESGKRIELITDTANYRGRAKLDRIILVPTEPATAAAQILSGQADFAEAFLIDQAPKLDSNTFARPIIIPQLGYVFLSMNRFARKSKTTPHPIFSDLRVRRALSMGVDRESMLSNVFGNTGRLSHGPFAMYASYADSSLHAPPFDTVAAKAMLDSSGWRLGTNGIRQKNGRPLRFTLTVPLSPYRRRYAVLIQEQFRKLGAQVDIIQIDGQPPFVAARATGDFDAMMDSFSPDPSPSGIAQSWSTSGIGKAGQNVLLYSNPKVDALLDSVTTAFSPSMMRQYASKAFRHIIDDAPAIWLYDIVVIDAANRRINLTGLRSDEWWANIADWTIPPDKRIDRDRIGLATPKP
jgi:peptide/nickel transport system substrate-binding protein